FQCIELLQRLDGHAHGSNRGFQLVGDIADKIVLQYSELLLLPPVAIQQEKGKDRNTYQYQRKEQLWAQPPRHQPESVLQVYLVRYGFGKTKDHTALFDVGTDHTAFHASGANVRSFLPDIGFAV